MKTILKALSAIGFIMAMAMAPFEGFSQNTYEFGYDAAGNRVSRTVILFKSATTGKGASASVAENPLMEKVGIHTARIYPNPTKGVLHIELVVESNQEASVSVYDFNGKLIRNRHSVRGSYDANISSFPSGTYILRITIGQESREWKIVKE
jgi:hypothetical protein